MTLSLRHGTERSVQVVVSRTTNPRHPERSWRMAVMAGFCAARNGFAEGPSIDDPGGIERTRPIDIAHPRSLSMTLSLRHGTEPVSYTHLRAHETVLDL